jgi:predicted nucleic-acid-binding Zn-ribbon protein
MPCKTCASANQQEFQGELTVTFTGRERINLSPVYVCQKTLVCLDCGYTEFVVPAPQLEQLNKGLEVLDSKGESAH